MLFITALSPIFISGFIGWYLDKKHGIACPPLYWALGALSVVACGIITSQG